MTFFTPLKGAGTTSGDRKTHTCGGFSSLLAVPWDPAPIDHLHPHSHFRLGDGGHHLPVVRF